MNIVDIESGLGGRRPDPPQQAEPVTMGMIECESHFPPHPWWPNISQQLTFSVDAVRDDESIEGFV